MKAEGHLGRCYLKGRAGDAAQRQNHSQNLEALSGFLRKKGMTDESAFRVLSW